MLNKKFHELGPIPIFGMLHLSGPNHIARALEEIAIYEAESVDGVIVENYVHRSVQGIEEVLKAIQGTSLHIGVNVLPNDYEKAFALVQEYSGSFIQVDYVAGRYRNGNIDEEEYLRAKEKYPNIVVLGGVWPKYYCRIENSVLEDDLQEGMRRAEAIVVTGERTGKETPIQKIRQFRRVLKHHPLIIGAGLDPSNAYEQLRWADGAIVGSSFKPNANIHACVEPDLIRPTMDIVRKLRDERYGA